MTLSPHRPHAGLLFGSIARAFRPDFGDRRETEAPSSVTHIGVDRLDPALPVALEAFEHRLDQRAPVADRDARPG